MKEHPLLPGYIPPEKPIPWEAMTKIHGPIPRHIEQLWDEVKKLRGEINQMKSMLKASEDAIIRDMLLSCTSQVDFDDEENWPIILDTEGNIVPSKEVKARIVKENGGKDV